MQIGIAGYDAAQAALLQKQVRQMRAADMALRGEAQRIQAQARAAGQMVTTQVSHAQGPGGQSYVASITITRMGAGEPRNILTEGLRETGQRLAEGLALSRLRDTDAAVRAHEGLHFRAAGGLAAGLPRLEYVEGPDGRYYAVAGQVAVQAGATSDPEKASRDAAAYARAAMAPGDASAQDMAAARNAHAHAASAYGRAQESNAADDPGLNLIA